MTSRVAAFIARHWSLPESLVRVELDPLGGGLESQVVRARISGPDHPRQLVVKKLAAPERREADVYRLLWRHLDPAPAVRMLGREQVSGETYLYLEDAQSSLSWPWSDTALAAAVCRDLARFHDTQALPHDAFAWDYEEELPRSAASTLELARAARDASGMRWWRRLGDLTRVVAALPRIRQRLLSSGATVIHGDVHPGNVVVRGDASRPDVVLIDWARARIGSPLEDIASWLHSLGCWEPEARRRHDTLMRAYLEARRMPQAFDADVRVDYWLASASNGLSGAIRYHLAVLSNPHASVRARYDSGRAHVAWQRVIRRAAALLSASPDRCS